MLDIPVRFRNRRRLTSRRRPRVHIPVIRRPEQNSPHDIPDKRRNDPLPDIQPHRDIRRTEPDRHRDERHISDDMFEPQRPERVDGPPDADDLGGEVAALHAEVARQTHQPVAADSAQEDVVEVGGDLLYRCVSDDLGFVGFGGEDFPVCWVVRDGLC